MHLKRKPNEERVKGRGGYIKTNTKMNNVKGCVLILEEKKHRDGKATQMQGRGRAGWGGEEGGKIYAQI